MKIDSCRSCQAPIIWSVTRKGKRMPLDAEPTSRGKFVLEGEDDDGAPQAVFMGDRPYTGDRYESHFGSCPQAAEHSGRPRSPAGPPAAPAGSCRPDGDGFCATHPTCDLVRGILESLRANVR